jgi:hypothetical protein
MNTLGIASALGALNLAILTSVAIQTRPSQPQGAEDVPRMGVSG